MNDLLASWFPGGSGLTASDFAVFALLLAAMTELGRRAGAGVRTLDDYLRSGRGAHWAAAALALVSAEISALTVIGIPATAFRGDWVFLQFFLGAAAARLLVATVFLLAFAGDDGTVYGWLDRRFGPRTRAAAAGSFVVTRLLLSGVRLLAASAAAGALLGWGAAPTAILFTAVALAALARGGARAAIWTGAFQAAVVLGAAALASLYLLHRVDGGLPAALRLASAAGKTRVFDWGFMPFTPGFLARFFSDPPVFLVATITGFFGSAAAFGTDHEYAQKLIATAGPREGRRAMALSIAGSLAVLLVHLLIGTLLFVFYKQNPGLALPERLDRIFPHFAATAMPRILRGLVLSAIVMASVDAPLASLSAVYAADLRRLFAPGEAPDETLAAARRSAVVFALVLAALAALFAGSETALSLAVKAGGAVSGPLLGVFAFGLLCERRGDVPVASAFGGALALNLGLLALEEGGFLPVSWSWLTVLGAVGTFALAWTFSRPERPPEAGRGA